MSPAPDPRVEIISRAYCTSHTPKGGPPCSWCRNRAKDATAMLDRMPSLFDMPRPEPAPLTDPAENRVGQARGDADEKGTSRAAALAVFPKSGTQRSRILTELLYAVREDDHGGLTDEDLGFAVPLPLNTVRPRRGELVAGGWVTDSGLTRPTRTGHRATIWTLTERALAELTRA